MSRPKSQMRVLDAGRFLSELCALAALALAGESSSLLAAIAAPLALIAIGAPFFPPKSQSRLDDPGWLVAEIGQEAAAAARNRR